MTTSSHSVWHVRFRFFVACVSVVLLVAGCDSPAGAVRETRKNLDAFKSAPGDAALEKLEKSLSHLEAKVRELEAEGDLAQGDLFRRQWLILHQEYRAMRAVYLQWKADQAAGVPAGSSGK